MLTGIDHFIVAVADPDDIAVEIDLALGLSAAAGGRHEAHGTHNRLIWLGDSYIELMGVFDWSLAAESWFGSHALAVIDRGGGQMGLVFASDDLAADVDRLRAGGSVLCPPEAGERLRPDGRVVRWRLAHAERPDPELGLVFLIEHDTDAAEWTPEERAQRAAEEHPLGGPARLVRVELPSADVRTTLMRLHREVDLAFRPSLAGGGARDASAGDQVVRLRPAVGGAGPTVVIRGGSTARRAVVAGCEWEVEPDR